MCNEYVGNISEQIRSSHFTITTQFPPLVQKMAVPEPYDAAPDAADVAACPIKIGDRVVVRGVRLRE